MQPAARVSAAIELLADIEEKMASHGAPADVLVANYFRNRRYAGSKDRRAITDTIYIILRQRERYSWALRALHMPRTARNYVLVYLFLENPDALGCFGQENPFAPTKLTDEEETLLVKLRRFDWQQSPLPETHNIPKWVVESFQKRFGSQLADAAQALNQTASLDIRLNPLKTQHLNLFQILKKDSELFEKNKFSEHGYRATGSINLGGSKAYRDGLVEVQDEAAQVASALVDVAPAMQVVDLCAGAGGKTLALAAAMENKGQIHAYDIIAKRLSVLKTRMNRAGARNIQVHTIAHEGAGREIAFGPHHQKMDRVIVDAPCTGTGTWRRSPDQRWRYDKPRLEAQTHLQLSLLQEAGPMVAVGGRLVYMTCSVMPEENEGIIEAFMANEPDATWKLLDYRDIWRQTLKSPVPETLSLFTECLQLAPHSHGTDGFFVAILERQI